MVVYRGLGDPRLLPRPSAVAVGNFDGLHLGHRRILARLCALAEERGLRSLVLTFEPHPERALGKRSTRMIDTPEQRLERLRGTCVDAAAVIPFNASFSGLGCREFVDGILRGRLGAEQLTKGRVAVLAVPVGPKYLKRDRRVGEQRFEPSNGIVGTC